MAVVSVVLACGGLAEAQPQYQIIAITQPGQSTSNMQAISPSGEFAIGAITMNSGPNVGSTPVYWSEATGAVALPRMTGRIYNAPQGINDSGIAAGTGSTTFFGSSPLPGTWNAPTGTVAAVPIPAGESIARIYAINNSGEMVGSVDGGSFEQAARYTANSSSVITETFSDGGILRTAYGISSAGRIVGQGLSPSNAAVTRGFYIDPGDTIATDIGALAELGHNSAIPFAVSSNGLLAGSSSLNSGSGLVPFLWSEEGGMTQVPLLAGTSSGQARGVNADGWTVGNMSSTTSIIFINDGSTTHRLQDLLANPTGWDLVGGTSNGAFGIADNGTIIGRGLLNNLVTGFVAVLIEPPLAGDYNGDGTVDTADYTVWRDMRGLTGTGLSADGNGDQVVDGGDYDVWRGNFGTGSGAVVASPGNVPEPATIALAGLALMAIVALRRSAT